MALLDLMAQMGDLENMGKQIAAFINETRAMLQTVRDDAAACRAELLALRAEHKELHDRHATIMGWISTLDEEELEEVAEGVATAAAEAQAAAADAAASAAQAEVSAEIATEEIRPLKEASAEESKETVLEETPIPEETKKPEVKKPKRLFTDLFSNRS